LIGDNSVENMTDYRPDAWSSIRYRNVAFSLRHDMQIDFATIQYSIRFRYGVFIPADEVHLEVKLTTCLNLVARTEMPLISSWCSA
jgi:hypothetical protein